MAVGLVVLTAVVAGLAVWLLIQPSAPEQQPNRLVITPLPPTTLSDTDNDDLAISPDGRHLLYRVSGATGQSQFYLRSLDDFVDRPIPGTVGGSDLFFSPDGESIGFFSGSRLRKVSLAGGSPTTLCTTPGIRQGGDWFEDTIVFAAGQGLYRVSASGGEPEMLATVDPEKGVSAYRSPQFLPDGKGLLVTIIEGSETWIAVVSLETKEQKLVLQNARQGRYLPTGHILYEQVATGTLMAVPFDLASLEVAGDSVQVVQGVRQTPGNVDYAVSDNGTLVYIPGIGGLQDHEHSLVWVDREGKETLVTEEKRPFSIFRISPDGKRLAISVSDDTGRNVHIYDFEADSFSRLTLEDEGSGSAVWSPDGNWLVFQTTAPDGTRGMARQPADRSSPPERMTTLTAGFQMPFSWSPDGRFLAFGTGPDIGILPMEEEGEPEFIIASPAAECCAKFSPDGKWIAYVSNDLGRRNVYVRPFPGPDVKWLISEEAEGGGQPIWAPDGKELFYRTGDRMMVVSIQAKDQTMDAGKPRVLFEGQYVSHNRPGGYQMYDISPDGQRFLMMKEGDLAATQSQINVVQNWFEELKRLVPTN
jgi:serine/threonine-protein kinase